MKGRFAKCVQILGEECLLNLAPQRVNPRESPSYSSPPGILFVCVS